jgi:oligopeptide/dipeptide ABC transporter ATP-binding protein
LANENSILLEVRQLRTYFFLKKILKAVDGVSFTVAKGKTLALVGESGAGKSVTCQSIMRNIYPPGRIVSGLISWRGQDLIGLTEREMSKIRGDQVAMVFQNPLTSLNPLFTVGEQLKDALLAHRRISKGKAIEMVLDTLSKTGIKSPETIYGKYACELSAGTIQQAMFGAAMLCEPKLILADEVTSNLDILAQAQILLTMKQIQKKWGPAIIMVTHDLGVATQVADDILVMYGGKCVEYAPSAELLTNPLHPYTQGLISSVLEIEVPRMDALKTIPGTPPDMYNPPEGCCFSLRCPKASGVCSNREPELIAASDSHHSACFEVRKA